MALWEINIKWVVNDIKNTSVYYPIYEWIVNGIHAFEKSWKKDGKISIKVIRSIQTKLWAWVEDDGLEDIESFVITDNWVWFDVDNQKSFRTFKSDYKLESHWGKWFGRFFYLKFFEKVEFESVYQEWNKKKKIKFSFNINAKDMMSNPTIIDVDDNEETWTKLSLTKLKKQYITKLNSQSKKVPTLWRKLLEHLLMYFVDDNFNCPEIVIFDEYDREKLNSMIWNKEDISVIHNNKLHIPKWNSEDDKVEFWLKIFKVKYSIENNTISLCWHNRVVIEENLWKFIPDFNQKLKESTDKKENNYSIKCYVYWDYLDDNVDTERESFNFIKDDEVFEDFIWEKEIFSVTTEEIKKLYKDFLDEQQVIKVNKVKNFINKKAPWYSALYKNFDLNTIDSTISEDSLDARFHELKYKKEKEAKVKVNTFVKTSDFSNESEVRELVTSLDDLVKTDLAHYVATRKFTLDLLEKSLEWDEETKKYKSEDSLHTIIFPTKNDSETVNYNDHNMWVLDEKLAFVDYISSDIPLNWWNTERWDVIIFDKKIAFRWENTSSNPITIFEFKKPWRDDFVNPSSKEDPVQQIIRYVNSIVDWKYKTPKWKNIQVAENTPFYWYVVCTLTEKVKSWLQREKNFKVMPDWQGYFDWYWNNNLYIEVVDWDKIL